MGSYRRKVKENLREAPTADLIEEARSRVCEHAGGHEDAYAALDVLEERLVSEDNGTGEADPVQEIELAISQIEDGAGNQRIVLGHLERALVEIRTRRQAERIGAVMADFIDVCWLEDTIFEARADAEPEAGGRGAETTEELARALWIAIENEISYRLQNDGGGEA